MLKERKVGKVLQYYAAGRVVQVKLTDTLRVDDLIHIKGVSTDFKQEVEYIYIDQDSVEEAKAGDTIWLGVIKRVEESDEVFVCFWVGLQKPSEQKKPEPKSKKKSKPKPRPIPPPPPDDDGDNDNDDNDDDNNNNNGNDEPPEPPSPEPKPKPPHKGGGSGG
jgi:hypothetical protein